MNARPATAAPCATSTRRAAARAAGLNGIDSIEVSDDQRTLTLTFLERAPEGLTKANVRIDGGRRVTGIKATGVDVCGDIDREMGNCLEVEVDQVGDFSTYTLCLVEPGLRGRPGTEPLAGFDPRYACIDFSFKASCPSDLDCAAPADCPPPSFALPALSYLARDYESLRTVLFDRLALLVPDWNERHIPDIGVALVEALAYTGDYLSYQQDAVATEAYLGTARRRISVRRHARLVDYRLHEGCNARAWVALEVDQPMTLPDGRYWFAAGSGLRPLPVSARLDDLKGASYEVFEPMAEGDVLVRPAHNRILLWTWGGEECCLPAGSTRATLRDDWVEPTQEGDERQRALRLQPGDVVVFEEVLGPRTGAAADADPRHRQAVRLTKVTALVDEAFDQPVVDVEWATEDALAFALCLSSVDEDCRPVCDVSVAWGNVVLVDHGAGIDHCGGDGEPFGVPPDQPAPDCGPPPPPPPVFEYTLAQGPVTHAAPWPDPDLLTREQAAAVRAVPAAALARMRALLRQAEGGERLTADEQDEVRLLFGNDAAGQAGFVVPHSRPRPPTTAEQQVVALTWLLARADRLLEAKQNRLDLLAARAAAGYLLDGSVVAEVAETWGAAYSTALAADDPANAGPAAGALVQDPAEAVAVVRVAEGDGTAWTAKRDLLDSGPGDRDFAVEVDDDGHTTARFGDGVAGRRAPAGATMTARYRVGNGTAGNVGRETISTIVFCDAPPGPVARVRNPLAAAGGVDPETVAHAKEYAPVAFRRRLERAVTASDYEALADEVRGVQRASAELVWTGAWYEARVAVDALGSDDLDPTLAEAVDRVLEQARRIGHDVAVAPADDVPLDIAMTVCVQPFAERAHVEAGLRARFGTGVLAHGRRAFFHPDERTFGDGVAVSALVAAALEVDGVEAVLVTRLQRYYGVDEGALASGLLPLRPNEIAQLDPDPRRPGRGRLDLDLQGGR